MALNGLYCADVPLSNCSFTHSHLSNGVRKQHAAFIISRSDYSCLQLVIY